MVALGNGNSPHLRECALPSRFRRVGAATSEDGIGCCEAHDSLREQDVQLRFAPCRSNGRPSSPNPVLHEYRVLSHLAHPSIPRVVDLILGPSHAYLCLDNIRGYSELRPWTNGEWTTESFTVWLDSLLSLLDYVHGMGFVHCNLTPRTVRVPTELTTQLSPVLRVTGFHRCVWESDGSSSLVLPRDLYHPPSESRSVPSPALDLFSVGALAAYVLSGRPDADAGNSPDAASLLHESAKPVPEHIMSLLQRMVSPDESIRPVSAAEIRSQLRVGAAARLGGSRPATECGLVPRRGVTRLLRTAMVRSREGTGHILVLLGPRGAGKTHSGRAAGIEARVRGYSFISCCRAVPVGGDGVVLSEEFRCLARDLELAVRASEGRDSVAGGSCESFRGDAECGRTGIFLFADDADKLPREDLAALVDAVRSMQSRGEAPLLVLACQDVPADLLQMNGVSPVTGVGLGGGDGVAGIPTYVRSIGELSHRETALLVSDATCRTPSPLLTDWMFKRGGGNPLLVRELISHLVIHEQLRESSRGLEPIPGTEADPVPGSIGSILSERIRDLPSAQLRVAEVVSLGPGVTPAATGQITGLSDNDVDGAMRALVRCGILRSTPSSREYAFSHELLRDMVYEGIPAPERTQLHDTVAEIWLKTAEDRPSTAQGDIVLAWHLSRGHHPEGACGCALNAVISLAGDSRADESVQYLPHT